VRGPASGEPPVLKVKKDAEQELRYHYDRDERIALAASPWFAPYVLFHTYAVVLLPLARRPRWMVGATLALWGLVILRLVL